MADGATGRQRTPPAFGLANTGAICYLNALLQALASCPHFIRAVCDNPQYMSKTPTGAALFNFARAVELSAQTAAGAADQRVHVDARHSGLILSALVSDLAARRPGVQFGGGMEGASEAVHLMLDMVEPASETAATEEGAGEDAIASVGQASSPIAPAFSTRVVVQTWCQNCHAAGRRRGDVPTHCRPGVVSYRRDTQYVYHMFPGTKHVATAAGFARRLRTHSSVVEDYKCEVCSGSGENTGQVFRVYNMTRAPPILQVLLPQFSGHTKYYYPPAFCFDSNRGTRLMYRLVAQVEHSGDMRGGHYWARALRADAQGDVRPVMLDDNSVSRSGPLAPNAAAYILFYHLEHEVPAGE
jgi:hypothetical protein